MIIFEEAWGFLFFFFYKTWKMNKILLFKKGDSFVQTQYQQGTSTP